MARKANVVLYLDKELVAKSKELGFNLSKTFENHLKQLVTQFSNCNSVNNVNSPEKGMKNMGLICNYLRSFVDM
jgi:Mn-dependent DtxR family transcriptional regulator